ncbi:methyltransferase domain-containing protein [Dactylosporangium sp. CA-092794]|uniref:class I SAM-dependent methyltransferase n=1 Tax=Dactylosporangium sp. CA-092794 TaxID=3239929 RepID=UPI003D8F7023
MVGDGVNGRSGEQHDRWSTVLAHLIAALPGDAGARVAVDGFDGSAGVFADRLAAGLRAAGRPCVRLPAAACATSGEDRPPGAVVVADGAGWIDRLPAGEWHLTVWVRTAPAGPASGGPMPGVPSPGGYAGDRADAVVDLHDPAWPVLRHLNPALAAGESWYRSESQAFFAARAATWDTRFGDDLPAYAAAVADAGLAPGGVVADVGCGTGRALPALRGAVGPDGTVIGIDLTPQMLAAARDRAGTCAAALLLADARRLPLAGGSVDAVFAAGLVNHLPDVDAGLAELARITRPGGRLVLFHPSGRAALAARHGRPLRPDEPLAEPVLRAATARAGWRLTSYDDPPHRFHAVAVRA